MGRQMAYIATFIHLHCYNEFDSTLAVIIYLQILGKDDEKYSEQNFQPSNTGNGHPVDSRDKYNFVHQQVSVFVAADISV